MPKQAKLVMFTTIYAQPGKTENLVVLHTLRQRQTDRQTERERMCGLVLLLYALAFRVCYRRTQFLPPQANIANNHSQHRQTATLRVKQGFLFSLWQVILMENKSKEKNSIDEGD